MNHGTLQSSDTVKSTSVNRPDSRHPSYRVIGTTRVKPDQLSSLNANKLGGLNKVSPVKSAELIVCKCGIRKLRSENVQFIFEVLVRFEFFQANIYGSNLSSCYFSVSQ